MNRAAHPEVKLLVESRRRTKFPQKVDYARVQTRVPVPKNLTKSLALPAKWRPEHPLNPEDQFRSLLHRGRSRDEALGELRRAGVSPIQCIKAIHEVEGASFETAKRILSESSSWNDVVEGTVADFIAEANHRSQDLFAILRIARDTSMRGAGLSLSDALSLTGYRELRSQFGESDLIGLLREHPDIIEEWLLYSDDKRTSGGWYLKDDGTIGQIDQPEKIRFQSLEQAVAAYVVRELDFWANLPPST